MAEKIDKDVGGDEEGVHPREVALGAVGTDGDGDHVASGNAKRGEPYMGGSGGVKRILGSVSLTNDMRWRDGPIRALLHPSA